MREGYRVYKGKAYKDPGGYRYDPNIWWEDEPLLEIRPWHPALFWKYLVHLAVWDENGWKVRRKTDTVRIARGQLYHSARWLGKRPGWSKNRVLRELEHLRDDGRITLETRQGGTLVTIVNYDPYQDPEFYAGTDPQSNNRCKPRKRDTGRDAERDTPKHTAPSQDSPGFEGEAGRTSGHRSGRRRDAPGTVLDSEDSVDKNARARGATPHRRRARQDQHPTPTPWSQIRGSRDTGIWASIPTHIRTTMLTEALKSGPAPNDLRTFASREANNLGIATVLSEVAEPIPDPILQELRAKLEKIRNGGRT